MLVLELEGGAATVERYEGVEHRASDLVPGWVRVSHRLEEGEKRLFDFYNGRFVDTGDLMQSLTEDSADGALREMHGDQLLFGSLLEYAVYLPGDAVLGLSDAERRDVDGLMLGHVTGVVHADR
jgi:hypothetical protein